MAIKCIAFDADHTLYSVHSQPAYNKKFEFLSKRTGIDAEKIRRTWLGIVDKAKRYQDSMSRSREYSTRKTLEELGMPPNRINDMVKEALVIFWDSVEIEPNPLAGETIDKLKARQDVSMVVVSDEYNVHLRLKLMKAGLAGFDFTIGPEETGELKPSIRFYEHLIEKTGLQPDEILMVGDSWDRDLRPAKALGLQTVLYRRREGNPDFFIDSLTELVGIIEGKVIIPQFFKNYDVRGKNPPLDGKAAYLIGKVVGSFIPGKLNIVVARDNKPSSEPLEKKLVEGMVSAGANVTRVGIGPSDYLSFATHHLKADFGVMVTASHLPPEYNGFKFVYREGNGFMNEDLAELKRKYLKHDIRSGFGSEEEEDLHSTYLDHAEKAFRKRFSGIDSRVVVDAGGGTAEELAVSLLERLGAKTTVIRRKRPLDCSKQENVAYLSKEIVSKEADIAVAFDLDADRLAVFDSSCKWVTGDELFSLADQELVARGDTVIASIDTSRILEECTKGTVMYTRVGDPFVISEALKRNAALAGEPNGHYCSPEFVGYNSGIFFSALFAAIATDLEDKRVALPKTFMERKEFKTDNPGIKIHRMMRRIVEEYEVLSILDGIKFKSGEATALIRPSGTSNYIRMAVEAKDEKTARKESGELAAKFF